MNQQCVSCGGQLHGQQSRYCSRRCLDRVRYQRPEVKAWMAAHRRKPEIRERILETRKARRQRPEVKQRETAYAKAYRERPEARANYKAYMEAYWKEYRERPGMLEHRSLVGALYRQRPDVAERLKASKKAYRDRTRDRQMAYFADYVVQLNGMYFNRKKDPAELIEIAERIKETKSLLNRETP